jgi:hypothetical protein
MGNPSRGHVMNMFMTNTERKQVVRSMNTANLAQRRITPFRVLENAGDVLGRKNYTCGGPNQVSSGRRQSLSMFRGGVKSNCDGSGIPGASCNPKYVYDSSTYARHKRVIAIQKNYNDSSFGGDLNRGAQSTQL